jgi:hypothetical protein
MNKAYLIEDLTKQKSQTNCFSADHNIVERNLRVIAKRKEIVERRKHKRFQVQDSAFVVLRAPGPHSTKVGQIVDMSRQGLAFRYIASEERSGGSIELEILLGDHSFYLNKIPFITISDCEVANEIPFSCIQMKRTGVQFGDLAPNQLSQIEYFIRNHTTGEV